MANIDLNRFYEWQREKPRRMVSIEIGTPEDHDNITIWVYDYDMTEGQHVTSVDEIDLEGELERKEREQYERLQRKFGEGRV